MDVARPKSILLLRAQRSNHAHLPAGSWSKLQRSVLVKTHFVTIGKRHLGDVIG